MTSPRHPQVERELREGIKKGHPDPTLGRLFDTSLAKTATVRDLTVGTLTDPNGMENGIVRDPSVAELSNPWGIGNIGPSVPDSTLPSMGSSSVN